MSNGNLISSGNQNGETPDYEPGTKMVIITHAELKQLVERAQKDNGKSGGAINNAKTAYNWFLRSRGLNDSSPIDGLFDDEDQFETCLEKYNEYLSSKGKSKTTGWSYVSHVRDYRKIYDRLAAKKLPDTFHEALLFLITNAGFTIKRFWRLKVKNFISYASFLGWCVGRSKPSVRSIEIIRKVEEILGVEEGILLNRLSRRMYGGSKRPAGLTAFGKKMQAALRNKYSVWTGRLQEQFEKLVTHMSSAASPEGFERNSVWTSSEGADIPYAVLARCLISTFFGFCCLPKADPDPYRINRVMEDERAIAYNSGMGMEKEKMSLALLSVKHLTVTYLEFQRIRAGGVYTLGTTTFIVLVSSLLRPGTGYIYQHPEFADHLEGVVDNDGLTWHERCVDTRNRLLKIQKDLVKGKRIEYGRDPSEPIQPILDLERPLSVIFSMLEAIKKDMPSPRAPVLRRAEHFRNFLLLLLLTANPLRIRMYSIMEIGKHLIKEDDGSWWMKFPFKDFKNRNVKKRRGVNRKSSRRANRDGFYKVKLPPEVWPHIEEYLEKYRPHLIGANSNRYLFLPSCNNRHKNTPPEELKKQTIEGRLSVNSLSTIVRKITYFYIPLEGNPGFGPHAFRHIVATDIIKKDPSVGFFLAAVALHDELETVEEEYVHLKTSEFFKPVSEHFSQRLREANLLTAA